MKYSWLKRSRVVISLVFLSLFTLMFLDFTGSFPHRIIKTITWLEFIPSFLTFKNLLSIAGIGFIIFILLSLLFGRIYCSTVCPLGIFQDVIIWLRRKLSRRKRIFRFAKPYNWMRYSILTIAVILFLAGNMALFNLLDPYSTFGKIVVTLVKPMIVWVNNGIANILMVKNVFWLYPVDLQPGSFLTLIIPLVLLALIVWMALTSGRLYCNTICPVGAFLGFVSRFSLFRIKMDPGSCNRCGKCSSACKSQCINIKDQTVDFSRCVGCFNCLSSCPSASIGYRRSILHRHKAVPATDTGKREFFAKTLAFLIGMGGLSKVTIGQEARQSPGKTSSVPERKNLPVSPPGSLSIEHFTDNCTACQLCVSVCPSHVLKPSLREYGFTGLMQPHMDYHSGYCNYECVACSEICPDKAILRLTVDQKKTTQIGKAHFIRENCIVYLDHTACGACNEHCPTQAVKMVPYMGTLTIPEVDTSVCIGCGACEHACPSRPYRAIFVDGNAVHQVAVKPKEGNVQQQVQEDFPF